MGGAGENRDTRQTKTETEGNTSKELGGTASGAGVAGVGLGVQHGPCSLALVRRGMPLPRPCLSHHVPPSACASDARRTRPAYHPNHDAGTCATVPTFFTPLTPWRFLTAASPTSGPSASQLPAGPRSGLAHRASFYAPNAPPPQAARRRGPARRPRPRPPPHRSGLMGRGEKGEAREDRGLGGRGG
jgi:hypothetical protein